MTARGLFRSSFVAVLLTLAAVALQGQTPDPAQTPAQTPPVQPPPAQTPAPTAGARPATETYPRVTLTVGRSTVLTTPFDIRRITITDDTVANVTVVESQQVLIDGKAAGTVSLIVWSPTLQMQQYDVVVDPGVTALQRQLQTLFPGEDINAHETPDAVILNGHASSNEVMLRAADLAAILAPKAKVLNLLQIPGGNGSQQVMLQVRIAEVNRRALTEVGTTLFAGPNGSHDFAVRSSTQQFGAVDFAGLKSTNDQNGNNSSSAAITLGDFLNIFVFNTRYNVGILIKALQSTGHFQSLAEPNLIAYNNQEASFLAGGELPVPVSQGASGQVAIDYKEFGVRLTFKPTIAGDTIRLKVTPEVSALDFANGITIGGFRVPALSTRRASTDVELRDGQSFAIAGLMNNLAQDTRQGIPWLSRIPFLGSLFRSRATNQDRTELLVLVTPHLVKAMNPDEVPPLPTLPGRFLLPCEKPPCDGEGAPRKGGGR